MMIVPCARCRLVTAFVPSDYARSLRLSTRTVVASQRMFSQKHLPKQAKTKRATDDLTSTGDTGSSLTNVISVTKKLYRDATAEVYQGQGTPNTSPKDSASGEPAVPQLKRFGKDRKIFSDAKAAAYGNLQQNTSASIISGRSNKFLSLAQTHGIPFVFWYLIIENFLFFSLLFVLTFNVWGIDSKFVTERFRFESKPDSAQGAATSKSDSTEESTEKEECVSDANNKQTLKLHRSRTTPGR